MYYYDGCEAKIAMEVIEKGVSEGWNANREDGSWDSAAKAEKHLAKFNIGYIDDMNGEWGYAEGGSLVFCG